MKVFVSQKMRGKNANVIRQTRDIALEALADRLKEPLPEWVVDALEARLNAPVPEGPLTPIDTQRYKETFYTDIQVVNPYNEILETWSPLKAMGAGIMKMDSADLVLIVPDEDTRGVRVERTIAREYGKQIAYMINGKVVFEQRGFGI